MRTNHEDLFQNEEKNDGDFSIPVAAGAVALFIALVNVTDPVDSVKSVDIFTKEKKQLT